MPSGPRSAKSRNDCAGPALALLWVAQIASPICLLGFAFVRSFNLPEANPLPQTQLDQAHAAVIAFAVVILVIPAIGCLLAAYTKHHVQTSLFGLIFVGALVLDCDLYAHDQRSRPREPAPVVTQCIPRSDGGHGCPGG